MVKMTVNEEEEESVLPRHTKVVITGNNRTKSVLVGLEGVVKMAVRNGGWHWLVLKNGIEVKLQRNALTVIEAPTGNENDDDLEFGDPDWSASDMALNDTCKSHRSRHQALKPTGSAHRTINRSVSCDSQIKSMVTTPRGFMRCKPSRMEVEEVRMAVNYQNDDNGGCEEEETTVLPRNTKVVVTGNNRTKSVLVGLKGVVKMAIGQGGWHWLVLTNGIEVKLQRNALSVIEAPSSNEDEEDLEIENSQWNVSDLAFDGSHKSHRSRHRALKPTGSAHKTISRTLSSDSQPKSIVTAPHGYMVRKQSRMVVEEVRKAVNDETDNDGCEEEGAALLPRNTKVVVTGNSRTKSVLVGLEGVVKMALGGHGCWHWLVLSNGIEVKLQRNALSVIEASGGNEDDGNLEVENSQWNVSDMAFDGTRKSPRLRIQALKPTGTDHKTISRSLFSDSQTKTMVNTPHGSMVWKPSRMRVEEVRMAVNDENDDNGGCEEETAVLPRNTKVVVTGNNRTKSLLVGLQGVVKMVVGGHGGWYWVVLTNGMEVKLQRNALRVTEAPASIEDGRDPETENLQTSVSDLAFDDTCKSRRSKRHRAHKPARPAQKTIRQSLSCDSRLKSSVTTPRGSMKIDLGKLEMTALRRYLHHFNLMDESPNPSKDQLVDIVQRHFMSQKLDELQVIMGFVQAAKKLKAMYK